MSQDTVSLANTPQCILKQDNVKCDPSGFSSKDPHTAESYVHIVVPVVMFIRSINKPIGLITTTASSWSRNSHSDQMMDHGHRVLSGLHAAAIYTHDDVFVSH